MRMKLKDFCEINPRITLKKGKLARKIAMTDLPTFGKTITNYTMEEYKGGTKFQNGDTLMARITPCLENGKGGYVDLLDDGEVAFGSTEYIVFREKLGVSDSQFLYYFINTSEFRDIAIKSMTGSSGRQRVQTDVISDIEFDFPELEEQKKIAQILCDLDDKIKLNNKLNANLMEMADAVFNSWFVKFDTFSDEDLEECEVGMKPKDWNVSNLLDIAEYLNGLAMQKYRPRDNEVGIPVLKIKELRQGYTDTSSELCSPNIKMEYMVENGDVIFSWSGSLLVDFWCGNKCGLNQHLFKVTSNRYDKWFYYLWTNFHLQRFIAIAADKATTMGHIKREDLKKSYVLIPTDEDYKKIGEIIKPLYDTVIRNRLESKKMAELRDNLLPRLMSGEINLEE